MKPVTCCCPGSPTHRSCRVYARVRPRCAACCPNPVNAFLGRAPGPGPTAAGAGRIDAGTQQPAVHQHPCTGRTVASGAGVGLARATGHARAAPRFAGSGAAPAGGGRAACAGTLRCVVATSSLDLGVDFPEVEQVLQLGSPKGVARLRQRAGRARHRPGASGAILCVPSHALELAEYAAVRRALAEGVVEARRPPTLSLDVLAQHAVSRAWPVASTVMRCWRRSAHPCIRIPGRGPVAGRADLHRAGARPWPVP